MGCQCLPQAPQVSPRGWPLGTCWKLRVVVSYPSPELSSSVLDTPGVSFSPGPQPATQRVRGHSTPIPTPGPGPLEGHGDVREPAWGGREHGLELSPPPLQHGWARRTSRGPSRERGLAARLVAAGRDTDLGLPGAHGADATTQMSFNLHDKVAPLLQADRMPLGAISENYLNNVMS